MDEPDIDPREEIERIVRDTLRMTVATHKRQVALRHGVRESRELVPDCDHADWDHLRCWCNGCGVTLYEIRYCDP